MNTSIRINWNGGERTFTAGTTISIGRDPSATIHLDDERVSRRHAELRSGPDGWTIVDLTSTSGTFLGNQRITEMLLRTTTTLRFGGVSSQDDVTFTPAPTGAPPTSHAGGFAPPGAPTEVAAPLPLEPTVLPGNAPMRPGGVLSPNAAIGATEVAGDTLNVAFAGQSRTLSPGQTIVLGRGGDLSTENPTVSRHHARVSHAAGGWFVEDLGSSRGTWLDGKKITRERVQGSMAFTLGPDDAGERLVVVAAGTTKQTLGRRLSKPRVLPMVSIGAVLLALAALVVVTTRGSGEDDTRVSAADLRAATVLLFTGDGRGSGSIIDGKRGLILTNAHVARPDAPGQALIYGPSALRDSPKEIEIYLSGDGDETARPAYRGEVVVWDGYLDMAIVHITRTATGTIIDPDEDLGLPEIPLGDSTSLDSGDPLIMFGYPGVGDSLAPQSDDATVSGFTLDARLSDNRAWINSSLNISSGNSGGLAADADGKLVGIPSAEVSLDDDQVTQLRPIHLALPLIEAATEGTEYTSPYVTPAKAETVSNIGFATDGAAFSTSCRDRGASAPSSPLTLSLAFDFEKFPTGHQDVAIVVTDADGNFMGSIDSSVEWPVKWGGEGCAAVSIPLELPMTPGTELTVSMFVGPNYERSLPDISVPV